MLCCVPKRLADGGPFYDEAPTAPPSIHEIQFELYPEEDASPPILLPCAICARTFMPQSLEKHARICERAAAKKRKPFDSAKQRIQGTELAEFLPKQEMRRHQDERGRVISPTWKKTHDDFLRVIREARGEVINSRKQCNSLSSSGAPTRANEKGTCPTCNRQFGIKAYDRHVAWCKDRVISVPVSPAVNLAKERLEARMRYRAPALKNRRAANREKYSSASAGNQCKTSLSVPALVKPKESVSMPNCSRESSSKQKAAVVRRPGQLKESPISSGPMKSRLADRTNKPAEDHDHLPKIPCRSPHVPVSSRRAPNISVSSLRPRINDSTISSNEFVSLNSIKRQFDRNETIPHRLVSDETRNREICTARTQRNIVSARSRGNPKLNDVAVNDKTLGVTVQPCKIYKDPQKNDQLVTWKQISRKKSRPQATESVIRCNLPQEFQLLDLNSITQLDLSRQLDEEREIDTVTDENRTEKDLLVTKNESDDELKVYELDKLDDNRISWLDSIQNLNQTYLIRDSEDIEQLEVFHSKWRPIKHSPRVEFYFKDTREAEVCEADEKKLKRNGKTKDKDIRITEHVELKTDEEDKEHDTKMNDEREAEIAELRTEVVRLGSEDEKDIQKMNGADAIDWDKIYADKKYGKDKQITMNENITEAKEIFGEIENPLNNILQNLSDSHGHKSSTLDVMYLADNTLEASTACEQSSSREFKIDFSGNNDSHSNNRPFYFKHGDLTLRLDNRNDLAFSDSFINLHQDYNICSEDKMSQYKNDTCRSEVKEFNAAGNFKDDKSEEAGSNVDLNDSSNIKTEVHGCSVDEAEITAGGRLREVHDERVINSDIEHGDGNTATTTRGDNDSESSITFPKDNVVGESPRKVVPDVHASVNLSRHVSSSSWRSVRERPRNSVEMNHKIRGSMNLLRDSTDSLISSVEFVELSSIEQPEAARTHGREIIKIIRPSKRSRMLEMLPDIPVETRETSERLLNQTYWERASKISRSRLISLDPPPCHVDYKLAKRNPRVRILPPVPNTSLIQQR
ncbi:UPF0418 protein FAM164A [Harpegnathos saltator]|uniref:UPF0418 protein FAM164A n=1 Tax=Harpegnathos saltator TaxID=610380 RepID=E2B4M4_HARSA|nr:UPF0418 protein FAM164A [Harpegnathos saltator]